MRALLCALSCVIASSAIAQSAYPTKPVRMIVPSAPGGGTDTVARVLAHQLSRTMGQQFVIDNRPGAGNIIGVEVAAKAAPDGYTLLVAASTFAINHVMFKKLPYDAVRDFAPITQIVTLPNVLVVQRSLPAQSLGEFIALAKQRPNELTFGSAGVGTAPHLAMELFKSMAGIELLHVPYKGVAPALTDIVAGRISGMMVNVLSAKPHVDAGSLRALAVSGASRLREMPKVPTIAEAGVPNYDASQWFGLLAPAGTPEPILLRLQRETAQALATPEMKARLAADGAEPVGSTPAQFAVLIREEMQKWAAVARTANIQPE